MTNADRIRAAWASVDGLPPSGYTQFRARVSRGAMVLTLHLLADGRVSVELEGYGDDLFRAVEGLGRIREALCS